MTLTTRSSKPTSPFGADAKRLLAGVAATILFSCAATVLIVTETPTANGLPDIALALVTTG